MKRTIKKRATRKIKQKIPFKDAVLLELTLGKEKEQKTLVTAVAKRVFKVKKAEGYMKRRAKSSITQLYNKGLLKKRVLSSGGVYWSVRGADEDPTIFSVTKPKAIRLEDYLTLRMARKNIELIEKTLREFFTEYLRRKRGDNWINEIPPETKEKIIETYRNHLSRQPNTTEPLELLSAAGIIDFFYILKDNRMLLADIISVDERIALLTHLKELSRFRNKVQHNEDLRPKELLYFNVLAERVIDDLEIYSQDF